MPNLQLVPISEGLIEYGLYQRLYKDKYNINEDYFKKLWLDNKDYMRIAIVDDYVVAICGFMPGDDGLLGYLVLTTNYPKYARFIIRKTLEILNKFKCRVKFLNHNDDSRIHKWYGLLGFKRVGDYWIREATNE